MDVERIDGLLRRRDAARDAYLLADAALRQELGLAGVGLQIDAPAPSAAAVQASTASNGNGRVAAAAKGAKPRKETAATKPAATETAHVFRTETAPRILKLSAKGNKTLVELARVFEKEMTSEAVYQQLWKMRGMNFVDREGDGYAIKPAGRAWLDRHPD